MQYKPLGVANFPSTNHKFSGKSANIFYSIFQRILFVILSKNVGKFQGKICITLFQNTCFIRGNLATSNVRAAFFLGTAVLLREQIIKATRWFHHNELQNSKKFRSSSIIARVRFAGKNFLSCPELCLFTRKRSKDTEKTQTARQGC